LHCKVSFTGRSSDKNICTTKLVPVEGGAIKRFARQKLFHWKE